MRQTSRGSGLWSLTEDTHCAVRDSAHPGIHYTINGFRVAKRRDQYRILRGGTYRVNLWGPRCAFRFRDKPHIRLGYLSLRIARRKA